MGLDWRQPMRTVHVSFQFWESVYRDDSYVVWQRNTVCSFCECRVKTMKKLFSNFNLLLVSQFSNWCLCACLLASPNVKFWFSKRPVCQLNNVLVQIIFLCYANIYTVVILLCYANIFAIIKFYLILLF
jgi:hypothetical protein